MRASAFLLMLSLACGSESPSRPPAPPPTEAAVVVSDAALDAPVDARPIPWTFAVLSDLHLPNPKLAEVKRLVAALIDMHVRLVVITGDHTNGNPGDHRRTFEAQGWPLVTGVLEPLRAAGIAVLPVAGNHDSSAPWQSEYYGKAFSDLARWAAPFEIHAGTRGRARPPFSYSVDVDGVHLSLVHLVSPSVEPDVAHWLAEDLEAATGATQRIVFGHVPMASINHTPNRAYVGQLGTILEHGHATLHVAGHEHLIWDEDVKLPGGTMLREVLVGCSSGFYQYGPSDAEKQRAHCTLLPDPKRKEPMRCTMPNGGAFELARGRKNRHLQHAKTGFVVFTVDGSSISVRPMTLDAAGHAIDFYLP